MPPHATAIDPSLLQQLVALSPGAVAVVRLGDELLAHANARMASLVRAEGAEHAPVRGLSLVELFDARTCSGLRAELALRGAARCTTSRGACTCGSEVDGCCAPPTPTRCPASPWRSSWCSARGRS